MKPKNIGLLVIAALIMAALACSVGGGDPEPTKVPEPAEVLVRPTATTAPAPTAESEEPAVNESPPSAEAYSGYYTVYDDAESLTVDIPAEWSDVDGSIWLSDDEPIGVSLWASTDIDAWWNTWDAPGVLFDVSARFDIIGDIDSYQLERFNTFNDQCKYQGREDYDDGTYIGEKDTFSDCGGTGGAGYIVIIATPLSDPGAFLIDVEVQLVSDRDWEALDTIIATFNVIGQIAPADISSGGYMLVSDDYAAIEVEVPAAWSQIDGSDWMDDGETVGSAITAAADLDGYRNTWYEPGVFFGVSDDIVDRYGGYIQLLDYRRAYWSDMCELDGRYPYEDNLYEGRYDLYKHCGGAGVASFIVLSARPINDPLAFNILVEIQPGDEDETEIVNRILDSFRVIGNLP